MGTRKSEVMGESTWAGSRLCGNPERRVFARSSVSPLSGLSHLLGAPSAGPWENEVGRGGPPYPREKWGLRFTAAGKARNRGTSGWDCVCAFLAGPAQNGRGRHTQDTGALLTQALINSYGISLEQFVLYSIKSDI